MKQITATITVYAPGDGRHRAGIWCSAHRWEVDVSTDAYRASTVLPVGADEAYAKREAGELIARALDAVTAADPATLRQAQGKLRG